MAYRMTYENTLGKDGKVRKDAYIPDKKDRGLARRLAAQNPYIGANQILSIQGREFISRRGTPYDANARGNNTTRFERYDRQAPKAAAPVAKPAPPPAPAPKAAPKPVKDTTFSDAAAALLKSAEANLAAATAPKEAEKMKIINSNSVGVNAAPLQIGPAAPPPKTSGVDSFKRKKAKSGSMKTLTANALNI